MEIENKPKKMSDTIAYQDGSVVSRTLVDKPAGTVTLFAFDKGQGLSPHKAPFEAIVSVIDGEAEIVIGDKTNLVGAGEFIILPTDVTHSLRAITPFKMMLTMIKEK